MRQVQIEAVIVPGLYFLMSCFGITADSLPLPAILHDVLTSKIREPVEGTIVKLLLDSSLANSSDIRQFLHSTVPSTLRCDSICVLPSVRHCAQVLHRFALLIVAENNQKSCNAQTSNTLSLCG